jgi:hypothetical protein
VARKSSRWVFVLIAVVAFAASGARAQKAQAGLLGDLVGLCDGNFVQPFAQFGDDASYLPVPNSGFEQGASGWSLSGAYVTSGNETFFAGGASDSHSLRLGSSGSATSGVACNGALGLKGRFFARNVGDPNGRLKVQVVYRGLLGFVISVLDVDSIQTCGSSWEPSDPVSILGGLTAVLPLGTRSVQLRFTASGGDWRIDDVYVDPLAQI